MKPPSSVAISCPACGRPIQVQVSLVSARSGPLGHTATLRLDWDASSPTLEEHLLADPDGHRAYLDGVDDDSASPDTQPGVLPGLARPHRRGDGVSRRWRWWWMLNTPLSRPRVRRSLGLHSPSLAMFGQCGCRHVCHGETFDAAEGFRQALAEVAPAAREAALRLAAEARGHAPVPAGAVRASVAGQTLPALLGRIDALVAEDRADRWPTAWTWGPPSEAAFDRWA